MGEGSTRAWVAHTHMDAGAEQQERLLQAQRDRRQCSSLRELLETTYGGGKEGSVGRMQAAVSGRASDSETQARLAELVNAFLAHAADQCESEVPDGPWPNMQEVPRSQGYRGAAYAPEGDPSYYRGGEEQVQEAGDGGVAIQRRRGCIALTPRRGSWEERLPANVRVQPDEVQRVVAAGGELPVRAPHTRVNYHGPGIGPWQNGTDEAGYAQASEAALRGDPVASLHLRCREFEGGQVKVRTQGGVTVACGAVNREAFEMAVGAGRQGDLESRRSLMEVCMPLHYRHRFTCAASVDGSADDPRRRGGSDSKKVAFGVFEGVQPEAGVATPSGGWDSLTQTERVARCVGAGMWGGALPQDWDNNDAEAYAILAYLQSVVDRSESPGDERVLVLSDSRAVLDVLEAVWRSKDASLCKARDRGAMIEGICALRARLGRVVFVWTPGHRGIIHNEMADCCAKAHLGQPIKDGIAQLVAEGVSTRDCLYEVQGEYDDTAWVLADRRCFRLARRCMGRWVRRRLLEGVSTLRYDAMLADGKRYNYGQGGFCTEVVKGFSAGRKVEPGDTCGDMRDDTARVGFVMGRRARDSGLPHERGHARQLSQIEPEDDGGAVDDGGDDSLECLPCGGQRLTAAQRDARLGCAGCVRWVPDGACDGCSGWLGRPAGALPRCTREDCPGTADADGWVVVRRRKGPAEGRVRVVPWLAFGAPVVQAPLRVVASGLVRRDGTCRGRVRLALQVGRGVPCVRVAIKVPREGASVGLRLSGALVRREDAVESEDPRVAVRADVGQCGAGRSARTRQAQTVSERLRREGARAHEDCQFDVGPARPLADLRHVMCACTGTEGRTGRVEGLIVALDGLVEAVPERVDTGAFHQVTRAARAALDATDLAVLTDAQWAHVDSVLAAFLPDFARELSTEAERRDMIKEVVGALLVVHGRAASLVGSWKQTHRHELERRRQQERCRGLMRTVMRAWREEADGRRARSLRVAVPAGTLVERGRHAGRLGSGDYLPVGRSAVPAGSRARLLLTYVRLVEGGRLRRRRLLCVEDWEARARRTRLLAEREGVAMPVVACGGDDRGSRRVSRAVGLHGGWGTDGQVETVETVGPVETVVTAATSRRPRPWSRRHGWAHRLLRADDGAGVGLHLVCGGCDEDGHDGADDGGGDTDDSGGGGSGGGGGVLRWGSPGVAGGGDDASDGGVARGSGGGDDSDGEGDMGGGGCGDGVGDGGVEGGCEDAGRGDGVSAAGVSGGDDITRLPRCGEALAFAGWGADGRELPFRRLRTQEGVKRPRALRATRLDGRAVAGALDVPVAYVSTVRRLELAPLGDDVHVPDQPAHARACEAWGERGERSGRDGARVASGHGMAQAARVAGRLQGVRRVAWAGLQAAGGAIRGSLGLGMGRWLARERTGAAGVQEQQQQQELEHDGPMRVEQPEHAEDEDGEPWQRAREESGGSGRMGGEDEDGSGRMGGEDDEGVRAAGSGIAMRKVCMHAGSFSRGQDSAGLGYGEDASLLGVAGSGGDDAVRLAGCEGSVSLAWRTGEG